MHVLHVITLCYWSLYDPSARGCFISWHFEPSCASWASAYFSPPLPPLIPMLWATVLCAVGAYVSVVLDLLAARVVLHLGTGFMPKVEAAGCPGHPSSLNSL